MMQSRYLRSIFENDIRKSGTLYSLEAPAEMEKFLPEMTRFKAGGSSLSLSSADTRVSKAPFHAKKKSPANPDVKQKRHPSQSKQIRHNRYLLLIHCSI